MTVAAPATIRTNIPARLGTVWILDGLEVTTVGSVASHRRDGVLLCTAEDIAEPLSAAGGGGSDN